MKMKHTFWACITVLLLVFTACTALITINFTINWRYQGGKHA